MREKKSLAISRHISFKRQIYDRFPSSPSFLSIAPSTLLEPLFRSISLLTVNLACSFPAFLWSLSWSIATGAYALFVSTSVVSAIYFVLFCYLFTIAASMIYRRILFEILLLRYPTLATCASPTELMAHLELVMSPFLPDSSRLCFTRATAFFGYVAARVKVIFLDRLHPKSWLVYWESIVSHPRGCIIIGHWKRCMRSKVFWTTFISALVMAENMRGAMEPAPLMIYYRNTYHIKGYYEPATKALGYV